MSTERQSSPILCTRCKLPGRNLWFARAMLYENYIEVSGWTWSGRQTRRIDLEEVDRFQWWAVLDDVNFLLHLEDGASVPMQLLRSAGTWNCKLHELLGQSVLAQDTVPRVRPRCEMAA